MMAATTTKATAATDKRRKGGTNRYHSLVLSSVNASALGVIYIHGCFYTLPFSWHCYGGRNYVKDHVSASHFYNATLISFFSRGWCQFSQHDEEQVSTWESRGQVELFVIYRMGRCAIALVSCPYLHSWKMAKSLFPLKLVDTLFTFKWQLDKFAHMPIAQWFFLLLSIVVDLVSHLEQLNKVSCLEFLN